MLTLYSAIKAAIFFLSLAEPASIYKKHLQSIHKCRRLPKKEMCKACIAISAAVLLCKRCAVPFASSSLSSAKEKLANNPHLQEIHIDCHLHFQKICSCHYVVLILHWMSFLIIIIIGWVSTVFVSANLALLQHKSHNTWRMFAVSIKCRKLSLTLREIALGATRVDFYLQPVEQWEGCVVVERVSTHPV